MYNEIYYLGNMLWVEVVIFFNLEVYFAVVDQQACERNAHE